MFPQGHFPLFIEGELGHCSALTEMLFSRLMKGEMYFYTIKVEIPSLSVDYKQAWPAEVVVFHIGTIS